MTPTSCPVCGQPVTHALMAGQSTPLSPRPYKFGPAVVLEHQDGTATGRIAPLGAYLAEGERRYSLHQCGGRDGQLDEVRKAQSAEAAKQRNQRGKWRPRHAGPRVGGMRITPRGEHR